MTTAILQYSNPKVKDKSVIQVPLALLAVRLPYRAPSALFGRVSRSICTWAKEIT